MSDQPTQAVVKKEPTSVEYVPYGSQDKVKMTVAIIQNLIAVKTKSGKTCSERDAIRFMAMCQAKRMNPFEGDCFLIGYDAKDGPSFALVTAHQTYLKRAELHPEFDGMKSGIIVQEDGVLKDLEGDFFNEPQVVVGGWATVYFKNRKQAMHKRLRLSRFQKMFGVWQEDPAGMICKCAEADALRSSFPTMLGGMFMREELPDGEPIAQPQTSRPIFTLPATEVPALDAPLGSGNQSTIESKDEEADHVASGPAPDLSVTESKPENGSAEAKKRYLRAIAGLCSTSNIKQSDLLAFLAERGLTDGSYATIEELPLATVAKVHDDWARILQQIKGAML